MKKLFLLGACLVGFASMEAQAQAQTSGSEVVVVQIYEASGYNKDVRMSITRGSGPTEDVDIKQGLDLRNHAEAIAYQRTFAKLVQEGYTLKGVVTSDIRREKTLIFEKRP